MAIAFLVLAILTFVLMFAWVLVDLAFKAKQMDLLDATKEIIDVCMPVYKEMIDSCSAILKNEET